MLKAMLHRYYTKGIKVMEHSITYLYEFKINLKIKKKIKNLQINPKIT